MTTTNFRDDGPIPARMSWGPLLTISGMGLLISLLLALILHNAHRHADRHGTAPQGPA
jgi:hypothetical protein